MANKAEIIITASDRTQQAFNSVRSSLNGLSSLAGNLGLGAAFSVAGIVAFTKSTIDALDNMNDLSKSTGIAVEKLAGLKLAAEQSGGDLESITSSINKLSVNIGKYGEKFAALGITAKDPLEAFKQMADIFVAIEDPQQRAAVAAEALGKSWQGAAPLLAEGSKKIQEMLDKGKNLSGITKEAAENADKFNDRLNELKTTAGGVGISLVTDLLPPMTKLLDLMGRGFSDDASFLERLKAIGLFLGPLAAIPALNDAFSKTPEEKGQAQSGKIRPAANAPKPSILSEQQVCNFKGGYWDGKQCLDKKPTIKTTKIASGKSEAEIIAEDMAKLLKSFQDATAPSQTLAENLQSQLDTYSKLDPQIKNYLQNIVNQTAEQEALSKSVEDTNAVMEGVQQANEEAQARINAFSEEYSAILKETQDINASLIENDQERAAAQLEIDHQRRIDRIANMEMEADEIDALLEAENERFAAAAQKNADEFKKVGSGAKDLGLVFKSAFEEAVTSGNDFGDVLDGLGKDIEKLAARRFILEPLLNSFDELFKKMTGGSGGGGGDFFSGLIDSFVGLFTSNADGGVYSSPSLSAFSGKVYNTPQLFKFAKGAGVFAEAGPEAILPLKRGPNGQLGVQGNGMGGANVTVNIIGAPAQPQVSQRNDGNGNTTIEVIFDTIKGALTKDIRSEGPFAQVLQGQYGLNRAAGAY